jgi:hypothetical protein
LLPFAQARRCRPAQEQQTMPDDTSSAGRFTTQFTTIPAGEVQVPGLPQGAAGSRRLGQSLLSSIAAVFTVSPDTARVLPPAAVSVGLAPARRFVPRRPASESSALVSEEESASF